MYRYMYLGLLTVCTFVDELNWLIKINNSTFSRDLFLYPVFYWHSFVFIFLCKCFRTCFCGILYSSLKWPLGSLRHFKFDWFTLHYNYNMLVMSDNIAYSCSWTARLQICNKIKHKASKYIHTFNGLFSGTTRVSRCQKGKTNSDFTEARDSEWQWHQKINVSIQVCTSLQTDNHASTPQLIFTGRAPFLPPDQQRQSTEG